MSRTAVGRLLNQVISIGGLIQGIAIADSGVQPRALVLPRQRGRAGSVGRVDAGVVDDVRRRQRTTSRSIRWWRAAGRLWDLKHPEDPDSSFE